MKHYSCFLTCVLFQSLNFIAGEVAFEVAPFVNSAPSINNIFAGVAASKTKSRNSGSLHWQQSAVGLTNWTKVSGSTALEFNPPLPVSGIYYFLDLVSNGVCNPANISEEVMVSDTIAEGNITGTSPIHYGTATNLELDNFNGKIQCWERKMGTEGWQKIANTHNYLVEIPANIGTWKYRAVITNGSGATENSPEFTLIVNPKILTITARDISKVYGSNYAFMQTAPGDFTVEGLISADSVAEVNLTSSGSLTFASCTGSPYTIVPGNATGTGLNNYEINYKTGNLAIKKALLVILADNKSRIYGAANPSLTYEYYGWANGIEPTTTVPNIHTSVSIHSSAGTYEGAITVSGGSAENYTFIYLPGNLTITKAPLTITAEAQTMTYGSTPPALSYLYDGWQNGENESALIVQPFAQIIISGNSNVGHHDNAITVSGAISNNYRIIYQSSRLTVIPKTVTPEINANNKNFDGTRIATISKRSLSGIQPPDEVNLLIQTAEFDNAQPGKMKLVTASGLKLIGPSAENYLLSSTLAFASAEIFEPSSATIAGPSEACKNGGGYIYSTESSMKNYLWKLSNGGIITSGEGTNIITVTWNFIGDQRVSVKYENLTGTKVESSKIVLVGQLPLPVITGSELCLTGIPSILYETDTGMNDYIWKTSSGGRILNGSGSNSIEVICNDGEFYSVEVSYTNSNGCFSGISNSVFHPKPSEMHDIKVYPVPNKGEFTLSISTEEKQFFRVSIYNPVGQKIYDIAELEVYGVFKKQISLKTITAGNYLIVFRSNNNNEIRRMTVLP